MLKIICDVSSEKDDLNIQNILNIKQKNDLEKQKILTFIYNMEFYSINDMIQQFDSLSSCYFKLKEEQDFINFLKTKNIFHHVKFCMLYES